MTSFILLLLSTSKLNTVFILCPPNKSIKIKNFWLSILSGSILFKLFSSNQLKTILTSHTNWIFGLGGLRLNTHFQYCDIRGWSESFVHNSIRMICERVHFAECIALYDRPRSYRLLTRSKTLVISCVTRLMLFSWQYIYHFCWYGLCFFLGDSLSDAASIEFVVSLTFNPP